MQNNKTRIVFFEDTLNLFQIDEDWIRKNHLETTFHLNLR